MGGDRPGVPLRAFLDTNVLIRHLTGDPPDQARRATAFLRESEALVLTHVVLAECAHVLRAVYEVPQPQIAALLRSALVVPSIRVIDPNLALRTLELYGMGFAFVDAYCVACAELSGVGAVASFDRELARSASVTVVEP